MFLDLYTLSSQKFGEAPNSPVKKIAWKIARLLPGSQVTVAKLNDVTIGVFQTEETDLGPRALFKQVRQLAPGCVIVRSCNFRELDQEELSELYLTATLVCREASFKGFKHLTPTFMAAFAKARPNLHLLDLRMTNGTFDLIEAFLTSLREEHDIAKRKIADLICRRQELRGLPENDAKEPTEEEIAQYRSRLGEIETRGIVVRIARSDLSNQQKKKLHLAYPYLALKDTEQTCLDLSQSKEDESRLSFQHLVMKVNSLPCIKKIDLSGHRRFCLFSLLAFEKKTGAKVHYEPPLKLVVPKSIETLQETHAPSVEEVENVLNRFYPGEADIDLCQLTSLSALDILYLEKKYPEKRFSSMDQMSCVLSRFDIRVIELICRRFPRIELELTHTTSKQEKELFDLLDVFGTVKFLNKDRVAHLLADQDLLKGYLKRSLGGASTTTLSDDELQALATDCPEVALLVSKIISYRQNPASHSAGELIKEIGALAIHPTPAKCPDPHPNLPYSLVALIKKYGSVEAHLTLNTASPDEQLPSRFAGVRPRLARASLCLLGRSSFTSSDDIPASKQLERQFAFAIMHGEVDVNSFVEEGADPHFKDFFGRTALHLAVERGREEVVERLIEKGADINAPDFEGRRPLHWAVEQGYKKVLEVLLAKGADVNAEDSDGRRPLHIAVHNGNEILGYVPADQEIVMALIERGADINAKDHCGLTAIHLGAKSGQAEVVEALHARGADINAQDHYGLTATHSAVESGKAEVVEALLARGADSNAQDHRGLTPLHMAAQSGSMSIVGALLAEGADPNTADQEGMTPLHSAYAFCWKKVAALLIAKGADINALDNNQKKPRDLLQPGDYSIDF